MTLWEPGDPTVEGGDADDAERTWELAELGRTVRTALARAVPGQIWVRGEIRGYRPANRSGHCYFDLVTPGETPDARPLAKFSAALFRRSAARVNARLAAAGGTTRLADGVEVRLRVRLDWWVPGGQLRLVVADIDPAFTLGQLAAQRGAVLAALRRDGLLERNAALRLSPLPLRVGLVTSAGSAAHADVANELAASGYRFRVTLADARMQGTGAPAAVTRAVASFTADAVDVIMVVRGGGARTDLAAFDGEQIARAIATAPVPVLCGIGHETDRSVADEVAHTAAKTPTACAALLVERVAAAEALAEDRWAKVAQRARAHLGRAERGLDLTAQRTVRCGSRATRSATGHVDRLAATIATAARGAPPRAAQRLARRSGRTEGAARRHLSVLDERLDRSAARLLTRAPAVVRGESSRLEAATARLHALDPARILARGWSITRHDDGSVVRDLAALRPGQSLVTTLRSGVVRSDVSEVYPDAT